ncbi:hypothetical protein O181_067903 [Austropuccinia psidii MF-1]|uniref:Copia protein n=1 Tax=Austropuccinia psidii MF-1 TaxID=1389203 RepID=A0A9Q3I4Z2_9BASI|nr:hypothetical protein [Austropuccinia psidii MF-1]
MNTTSKHWAALEHLICYMRGTMNKALVLDLVGKARMLEVYVDVNWGGEGSRSQHGFIGFLLGLLVVWNSKRQTCVASSTCQAEYMAMSFAVRAGMWISQCVTPITARITPILLLHNQLAVKIANDSGSRKNLRHIKREFHLINEMIVNNKVTIKWITTREQKADIFTKKQAKVKVDDEFCKGLLV